MITTKVVKLANDLPQLFALAYECTRAIFHVQSRQDCTQTVTFHFLNLIIHIAYMIHRGNYRTHEGKNTSKAPAEHAK